MPQASLFILCESSCALAQAVGQGVTGLEGRQIATLEALLLALKHETPQALIVDGSKWDLKQLECLVDTLSPSSVVPLVLWGTQGSREDDTVLPVGFDASTLHWTLKVAGLQRALKLCKARIPALPVEPLLDSVIHTLNNLLGILIGYLDLLGIRASTTSREQQTLETMKTATERMGTLLKQLATAFPKVAQAAQAIPVEVLILGALKRVGLTAYGALQGLEVIYHCPKEALAKVDAPSLAQTLCDLIINAYESYTHKHYKITLEVNIRDKGYEEKELHIVLKDTGPGLDPRIADTAQEPFVSTKPQHKGLGLTLARQTLRAQGGNLQMEANSPTGLTLTITQPFF